MNAKDEGQRLSVWRLSEDRKHVESSWQGIWAPLLPSEVVKALKEYERDRTRLNALQQQVTELEEERDEAKHLLEQSLLELDARIEEQADYMEVVKKQQQALLVLKAWIKSSKEDAATVNYEGIAQIVNEAYEAAETLTSPSTAQEEQR